MKLKNKLAVKDWRKMKIKKNKNSIALLMILKTALPKTIQELLAEECY